jgi:hypothetical protein
MMPTLSARNDRPKVGDAAATSEIPCWRDLNESAVEPRRAESYREGLRQDTPVLYFKMRCSKSHWGAPINGVVVARNQRYAVETALGYIVFGLQYDSISLSDALSGGLGAPVIRRG